MRDHACACPHLAPPAQVEGLVSEPNRSWGRREGLALPSAAAEMRGSERQRLSPEGRNTLWGGAHMKSSTVITEAAKLNNYPTIKSFDSRLSFSAPPLPHLAAPGALECCSADRGERTHFPLFNWGSEVGSGADPWRVGRKEGVLPGQPAKEGLGGRRGAGRDPQRPHGRRYSRRLSD